MKKLSKKDRNIVYKEMLESYEKGNWGFMCILLGDVTSWKYLNIDFEEFILFTPIDIDDKDLGDSGAWFIDRRGFNGWYASPEIIETQKIILEFCIEMSK